MLKATIVQSVQPLFWDLLKQSREVVITSAYVDDNMVRVLQKEVSNASHDQLKSIDVILGLDEDTSSEALELLLDCSETPESVLRVRWVGHRPGSLFHPKLYYFVTSKATHILIGSGNFTDGGLSKNHEIFCHIECSTRDAFAQSVKAVLEQWKSGPFSKQLAEDIVISSMLQQQVRERASSIAKSIIEQNKELSCLLPDVETSISEFAKLLVGTAGLPVICNAPTDPQAIRLEAIREKLNEGIVISCDVSLSKLRVPIDPEVMLPDRTDSQTDRGTLADSHTIVIGVQRTAYVKLLPPAAMKEFEKFRGTVEREIEKLSINVRGAHYVPQTALSTCLRIIRELRVSHKKLLAIHISRASPILNHLKASLADDVREILTTATPNTDARQSTEVIAFVRRAAEDRRVELRKAPSEHLPFSVVSSPHPLVIHALVPDHPAWKMLIDNPNRALVDAFVDLLIGQAEAIEALTQYKQQAALKRQIPAAKLLISVRGKTVNRLLKQLQTVAQDGETKTGTVVGPTQNQARSRSLGKIQLLSGLDRIRSTAKSHIKSLQDLHSKEIDVALEELFAEYELKA